MACAGKIVLTLIVVPRPGLGSRRILVPFRSCGHIELWNLGTGRRKLGSRDRCLGATGRWLRGQLTAFRVVRDKAASTTLRRSTSMRNGLPEEYSAWNITFQDWQIMRRRATGSSAEN